MSNDPDIKTPVSADAKASSKPREIAGFEIIGKLGQGGMGAVFKARQKSLDRIVALKVLPPSIAKDAKFIERFQREARASAKLNHPHIVQGIDVGKDPATGLWYFAMEYVDGPSLKKVLDEQKVIPQERALAIVREVAQALETIGSHAMVHRDIKPDNILLTQRGETKLADLGLAKQLNEDASLTQSGQAVGTPFYMAPEQVRGQFEECDIRTDIYALGATFFHLVTGHPPFKGETSALIMSKHLTEPAPKAHKVNPAVSESCGKLIEKMMQKKIEQRVQSPAELIAQIDKVLKGEPAGGAHLKTTGPRAPVGERRRESEEPKRNPAKMYAGIAGIAIVAVILFMLKGGTPKNNAVTVDTGKKPDTGAVTDSGKDVRPPEKKAPVAAAVKPPVKQASPEELFKAAQEYEQKNPEAYDEVAQQYQRVIVAAKGQPQEAEIQDKVEDAVSAIQTKKRNAIEKAWKAAEEKAETQVAAKNYDEALVAYQNLPPKIGAALKEKIEERVRALHQEAEEKITTITKKAEALAADIEPAEALKILADAEQYTYSPTRGIVLALKKKLSDDLENEAELKQKKADMASVKRFIEVMKKFDDALLENHDLKAAAEAAAEAKKEVKLAQLEKAVQAMNDVIGAYDEMARFEQDALARQIGQKLEHETPTGLMKGTVSKIQDGVISLKVDFGGGAQGEKKVKVADLSEAERKKLFPVFTPQTDAQRVAYSYTRLSKVNSDYAGALEQLVLAQDFALTPHCRDLANKMRAEKEKTLAEAAAPAAWADIYSRGNMAKISEADAKVLSEKIARFDKEFGKTQFYASIKDKVDAIKAKVANAAAVNLVVNGDFEKGSFEGWQKTGGTNSGQITSEQTHSGKHAFLASIQPDYNTTLTQMISVEPRAEYRLSCWVKHLSGSLEGANRSALYILEGQAERRESEATAAQILSHARLGEWVKVETKYTPQTSSVRIELFLRQRQRATDTYTMLIDDIELIKISGGSAAPKAPVAQVPEIFKAMGLAFWVAPGADPAVSSRELLTSTPSTDKGQVAVVQDNGLKALQFDNSYTSYPATEQVKAIGAGGSVFVWVKFDKPPAAYAGMLMRGDAKHADVTLFLKEKGFFLWFNYPENSWPGVDGKSAFYSKRPLTPGKWMMLGATWDSKTVTIWVNGEKDNVYNSPAVPLVRAFPEIVTLGCDPAGSPEFFNGLMSGAMIFNRPVSEFEIKSLYLMSGIIGK